MILFEKQRTLLKINFRCHSLSLAIICCSTCCTTCCHSLYHSLSLAVTQCQSLSLVAPLVFVRFHSMYLLSAFLLFFKLRIFSCGFVYSSAYRLEARIYLDKSYPTAYCLISVKKKIFVNN